MRKIIALIPVAMLCLGKISAQTSVFPSIPESDDFGLQPVNIDNFVPVTGDFTMVFTGKAGEPISIAAAHVEYTPEADGVVRFVQKDGEIYVFEGKTYKSKLSPTYNLSFSTENVLVNGSFETVVKELASGKWQGADWTPTDWNGEVKWGDGGDQVSVRENASFRSDGQKSIILHFSNRYLTQKLSGIESGTAYQFSCDYWTSPGNNNGGGKYSLYIGTTNRGDDLVKLPAYVTSTSDNNQHSFSISFVLPSASEDVYLSLFRDESKCDWLDNVKLQKVESEDKGITGSTSASYAPGAFMPVGVVLPEGMLRDRTDLIVNPSFENGFTGWVNNGMQTQTNNGMAENNAVKEGNTYVEKWVDQSSTLGDASVSQEITNIPNGAWLIMANGFGVHQSGSPAEVTGVSMFAGYSGKTAIVKGGNDYQVKATVAEGKLSIGFMCEGTDANWMGVDNFRLYQLNDSEADYAGYLAQVIAEFNESLPEVFPAVYNKEEIEAALSQAESAKTNEEILAAISSIRAAQNNFVTIKNAYDRLADAIAYAENLCADNNYQGKDKLVEAITEAKNVFSSTTATIDEVTSRAEALAQMSDSYKIIKDVYDLLKSEINIAQTFHDNSDYAGKDAFLAAIGTAKDVFNNGSELPDGVKAAVEALREASKVYLANRPEEWFTIKNGAIWIDDKGLDVQAHGAGIILVNDTWYMIGEDRTQQWNPDVNMYSSKDLVNWKFENKIMENGVTHPDLGSSRMIERPKLLYNKKTGKFVVWCHWEAGNYGASEAGVFVADNVTGPYKFVSGSRPLDIKSRDCNVFLDDDGTAYFISTIDENRHLGLFKLSDDYLSAVEWTQLFSWQSREAPAIVKHDGVYYMLSSACSGWDPNQCKLAWSTDLKTGWSGLSDIGNKIAYDTQAASILTVQGTEGTTYLYVGDRWQDPGLADSKTIIFPISFDNANHSCNFPYHQAFDINFVTGRWREHTDPYALSKEGWTVKEYSSQENNDNAATLAIDGKTGNGHWHSAWSNYQAAPHFITIDMGKEYDINGFLCMPRTDNDTNGLIRVYTFQVSLDGENWTTVSSGSWLPYCSEIEFITTKARYFKITALSGQYASISEIEIFYDPNKGAYEKPDGLLSYYQIDGGEWTTGNKIEITEGHTLKFGPNTSGRTYGSWNIELPDGSFTGSREYTIENFSASQVGTYKAHFTDMNNRAHVMPIEVAIKVISSIDEIEGNQDVVSEEYYTLTGVRIDRNKLSNGLYVCRQVFADGSCRSSKVIVK